MLVKIPMVHSSLLQLRKQAGWMVDMLYLEKCLKAWYVTVKLYVMSTILVHNVTNRGNNGILICF